MLGKRSCRIDLSSDEESAAEGDTMSLKVINNHEIVKIDRKVLSEMELLCPEYIELKSQTGNKPGRKSKEYYQKLTMIYKGYL